MGNTIDKETQLVDWRFLQAFTDRLFLVSLATHMAEGKVFGIFLRFCNRAIVSNDVIFQVQEAAFQRTARFNQVHVPIDPIFFRPSSQSTAFAVLKILTLVDVRLGEVIGATTLIFIQHDHAHCDYGT